MAIPQGVFSFGAAGQVNSAVLANPDVDGVSCGDSWALLEPTQGNFDWSRLDDNVNAISASGKDILIRIATMGGAEAAGGNTPDWVMTLVGSDTFTFIDGAEGEKTIPVFWNQDFLDAKKAMISAVGDRYAGNPLVKVFACHFANANSEDWAVPASAIVDGVNPPGSSQESRWVTAGWTHALMLDAAKQIFDTAMVAWPNQVIYSAIGAGKVKSFVLEPTGPLALPIEVYETTRAQWGERFVPGHNSFNGLKGPTPMEIDRPPSAGQNTWFVFGDTTFRMMPNGNPDNLTADQILRLVFDVATATGDVRWLEVYEKDVINLTSAITYGHGLLNPGDGGGEPLPVPPPPGGVEEFALSIRSLKFRDVIWGVAHKLGWITDCDPVTGGPSDDQFCELVSFCNAYLRRTWDIEDFPEWTRILKVAPDTNHFVPNPGRVLRMFLVDPRTTPGLVEDAPFSLFESRIHCGFEHGANVWIKYIQPPPVFTHEEWDAFTTYSVGNLVYSSTSGECYKSIVDNNRGNDPAPLELIGGTVELDVEVTQEFVQGVEAEPAADEVWEVAIGSVADDSVFRFLFTADDGQHEHQYVFPGGMTPDQMLDAIVADLDASSDTFIAGITYTALHAQDRIKMELSTARFGLRVTLDETPGSPPPAIDLVCQNTSDYSPGHVGQEEVPQLAVMTLDNALNLRAAVYNITARTHEGTHQVGYTSGTDEDLQTTLFGITDAIAAAAEGDPFWGTIVVTPDPDTNSMEFLSTETVEFRGRAIIQGNPNEIEAWVQVIFPQQIAEPVMDGIYTDALREEGQTDKALAETATTKEDFSVVTSKLTNRPYDSYTQQQGPRSRYRS